MLPDDTAGHILEGLVCTDALSTGELIPICPRIGKFTKDILHGSKNTMHLCVRIAKLVTVNSRPKPDIHWILWLPSAIM